MNYRSILIVCLATLGLAVAGWGQGVTSSGGGAWVAGVIHRLTDHSANYRDPSWSPDGRHIAFDSNRGDKAEIYVMGSDGSNPRRLTDHPAWAALPSWSPDGRHIAFESNRHGKAEIYVMGSDGSNSRRLTDHPAASYVGGEPTAVAEISWGRIKSHLQGWAAGVLKTKGTKR